MLTSEQYSQVFDAVDVRVSTRNFLFLVSTQSSDQKDDDIHASAKLGIIVAKKNIRHAVQRNRIKRLLRESFRHKRCELPQVNIVALAKKGADQLTNEQCFSEFQYLWNKLNRKLKQSKNA